MKCTICPDDATNNCRRCEAPLCGMHRPWKPELACLSCEEAWERGRIKRTMLLLPITLLALGVGIGIVGGAIALLDHAGHMPAGLGWILVMFGGPIMLALAVVRYVTRVTFRRRFLAQRSGPLPVARTLAK
ncbi:MAG TPA: hypothetical protein VIV11_17995 [Kofleriaceae bacterium]